MNEMDIRIAITPETLALLEMSMTEGDTYDAVIKRLMKTPWVKKSDGENTWFESQQRAIMRHDTVCTISLPEGLSIDPGAITSLTVRDEAQELRNTKAYDLLLAARAVRDDIARTVELETLHDWDSSKTGLVLKSAISAVMNTKNILALDKAVKAVFDE